MTAERAIKWLEYVSNCPIQFDDDSSESADIRRRTHQEIKEACDMAIKALKEKHQKKAKDIPDMSLYHGKDPFCGEGW